MFRREVLEKSGGYDPAFESALDTDLFLRILLRGARIGWLRKITCGLRQSPDGMLQNAPRQAEFLHRAIDRTFLSPSLPLPLKAKEAAIRYSTELWLAWHLWSRGFPAGASAALELALTYHREAAFIQARNWWRVFRENSKRAGRKNISQPEFLAVVLPAFPLSERGKERLGELLDWWWNVWSGFSENPPVDVAISTRREPHPVPLIVDLTKRCIQSAKDPAPAQTVARFWDELLRRGWVRPEEQGAVVTLYLACFTRALAARQIRTAGAALSRAIAAARNRRALAAWFRFFRSAARAFLGRKNTSAEEIL